MTLSTVLVSQGVMCLSTGKFPLHHHHHHHYHHHHHHHHPISSLLEQENCSAVVYAKDYTCRVFSTCCKVVKIWMEDQYFLKKSISPYILFSNALCWWFFTFCWKSTRLLFIIFLTIWSQPLRRRQGNTILFYKKRWVDTKDTKDATCCNKNIIFIFIFRSLTTPTLTSPSS